MRTLVIEDDDVTLTVAKKLMEAYGECEAVNNGNDGIKAYQLSYSQGNIFDLILLDIMMPDLDGQETLRQLRSWESSRNISGSDGVKIVMMTAVNDNQNILQAFREQCEGYIVKPIDRKKIVKQLQILKLLR